MGKWTRELIVARLTECGWSWQESEIQNGIRFLLPDGTPISLFSTGKVLVQGRACTEKTKAMAVFAQDPSKPSASVSQPKGTASVPSLADSRRNREVFIVYGHDLDARNDLELLLRRLDIKPLILGNLALQGKTIIEALIEFSDTPFAIVLLTPDDEGYRANHSDEKRYRARQNVVLELGMFLARAGRNSVAILYKGDIELPSDINGLLYIPFKEHVFEVKTKLASVLQKAGYEINIEALSAE